MTGARGNVPISLLLCLAPLGCREAPRAPPPARQAATLATPTQVATAHAPAPRAGTFDALLARAESLYFRGEYDSARGFWTDGLERARAARDSLHEGRILTWLGLAAWRMGDYAAAKRLGDSALALKLRSGLTAELGPSYNALGLLAWNEGRLTEALELFERTMRAARASGDPGLETRAVGNLALVHTELGDFDQARRELEQERDLAHAIGETRLEGNALNNLGMWFVRTGQPDRAGPLLRDARRLYASIGYATGEQQALGQLGTAYTGLGAPGQAIATLDSALALARAQGLRQDEASDLEALAEVYRRSGDLRRALALYSQAQAINADLGLEVETGADLRSQAEIGLALGNAGGARAHGETALALHQKLGTRYEELEDLLLLAQIAAASGDLTAAATRLAGARTLEKRLGTRGAALEVGLVEARIADLGRRPRVVLAAARRLEPMLGPGDDAVAWEVFALAARAYAATGLLDSAAAMGRRAVAAIETIRGRLASGVLRTAFLAQQLSPYGDLAGVLLRQGRADAAFEASDGARGRALLDRLTAGQGSDSPGGSAALLAQGTERLRMMGQLADRIDEVEREAAGPEAAAPGGTLGHLRGRLAEMRRDYEDLLVRAAEQDPRGTALLGGRPIGAREVEGALGPQEVLVEYLVSPERTVAFAVSRDGIRAVTIPVSAQELRSRVRLARDLLASPGGDASEVLADLRDLLIAPLEREGVLRGVRRLVLVPHDALGYLPFAALRDRSSGRYLMEDVSLLYMPIAGALPALRDVRRAPGRSAGPPAVFAPFTAALPATRAEAAVFRAAFPTGQVWFDDDATEAAARRALAADPVIHVASHGVMNAWNPMFSRIELSPGRTSLPGDDGRLEVHEILDLASRADLVFLSGCETGLGVAQATAFSSGQDYATLAQAFLYAGARNVVATLWRVEDAGAGALADRFYHHYRAGAPAEALALAQRDLLHDPRYSAPFYWAAYEVSGTGTGVPTVTLRGTR